jgi:hypothetical protein
MLANLAPAALPTDIVLALGSVVRLLIACRSIVPSYLHGQDSMRPVPEKHDLWNGHLVGRSPKRGPTAAAGH